MTGFVKNKKGKYEVFDARGGVVQFDYAIDASEALKLTDEKGRPRYMPMDSPSIVKKPVVSKDNAKEADAPSETEQHDKPSGETKHDQRVEALAKLRERRERKVEDDAADTEDTKE